MTTPPYDDNLSVDFGTGINVANNEYFAAHGIHLSDGGMISVMSQRCSFDYYVGELAWDDAEVKHLNEYRAEYSLPLLPVPGTMAAPAPAALSSQRPYDDAKSQDFGIGINTANAEYYDIHGVHLSDGGMISVMSQRCGYDYYALGLSWITAKTKHLNEYRAEYGLPPVAKPAPGPGPGPGPIEPIDRGPLPPWVQPVNYRITLPWEPPVDPPDDRDYWRGDAWGVEIAGAPWVPGASNSKYERILSWFVDRYPPDWQARYLETYAGYQYRHLMLSLADSCGKIDNGPNSPPGNGAELDEFIETCLLVKKYIRYVSVTLGSKYFGDFEGRLPDCPHNMSGQQWADWSGPILERLFAAGACDEVVPGWEWNLWNQPGDATVKAFKFMGQQAHAAGRSLWMHFSPHVASWQQDGTSRFAFYDLIHPDVDGLNYQSAGPYWSPQMLQARMVDSLWVFGTRGDLKFRLWEDFAAWMFDNDTVTVPVDQATAFDVDNPVASTAEWERIRPRLPWDLSPAKHPRPQPMPRSVQTVNVTPEYANQRGYIGSCAIDDVRHTDAKDWGYGNGGRRPDGTPL